MAQIPPIYSIEKESNVYHNNSECTESNNIEERNKRHGTGGKVLCKHCERLNIKSIFKAVYNTKGFGLVDSLI